LGEGLAVRGLGPRPQLGEAVVEQVDEFLFVAQFFVV
jgi:hypothetical protein